MDESNVKVVGSLEELFGNLFGAQQAAEPEPVEATPTITGPKGRAWQVDLSVLRAAAMTRSADLSQDHIVGIWIIERPEVLPYAHSYVLNLTSLDGEDREAYLEGATHEFSIFPLAPTVSRDDMLTAADRMPMIGNRGPVFAAQFVAASHPEAIARMGFTVQEVCNGELVPHWDADAAWVARFGDTNLDPEFVNRQRKEKAIARYSEAMHGLEVAAAYAAAKEPRNVEPTYLRNGIDSVNISASGLARLLIDKGIISDAEYVEAVADAAVEEYGNYASRLGLPKLDCEVQAEKEAQAAAEQEAAAEAEVVAAPVAGNA